MRSSDWSSDVCPSDLIYRGLFENAGAKTLDGRATLKDAHTVVSNDQAVTADKILIATGGHPVRPAVPGAELMITSNEAFHLKAMPKRIIIIGGGYIACEFAGIFTGFGAQRSEERRVGKECGSTCRSRGLPSNSNKNKTTNKTSVYS